MDFADFKDSFLFLIFLNDYNPCVKNKKTSFKQRYCSLSECKRKSIIIYNLADNRILLNVIGIKGRFWVIGISAVTLFDNTICTAVAKGNWNRPVEMTLIKLSVNSI